MMTRKQAEKQADALTRLKGEPWTVFKTPENATCNQDPFNMFNTGRYAVCRVAEEADYQDGGATLTGYRPQ